MNIGIDTTCVRPGLIGGIETGVRSLVAALTAYDYDNRYTLFVTTENRLMFERLARDDFRVCLVPLYRQMLPMGRIVRGLQWRLTSFVLKYYFDLAGLDLIHFPGTGFPSLRITTPGVVTFWDIQQEFFPEFFTPAELADRRTRFAAYLKKARRVIVPSTFTKRTLAEKYNVPEDQMDVVWNSIDLELGDVAPVDTALPDDFIFYPANIWPHKNHVRLIQAYEILRRRYGIAAKLILTGKAEQGEPAMRTAIAQSALQEDVIFLGYISRNRLRSLFTKAKAMVFPSLFEGYGFPVVEAMALGCPVVCSNTASLPELVGDAGILFDPMNIEEMAEVICKVLRDATLRQELAAKGKERARLFAGDKIAAATVAVYRRALERGEV